MKILECELYVQVEDQYGAVASVYESPGKTHHIVYHSSSGVQFFREDYVNKSIEVVERAAIDWATGKRSLEYAA
jgi:hypothetical protein